MDKAWFIFSKMWLFVWSFDHSAKAIWKEKYLSSVCVLTSLETPRNISFTETSLISVNGNLYYLSAQKKSIANKG